MANNGDWLPSREQDLVDLGQKWKAGLENPANSANFGWNHAEGWYRLDLLKPFPKRNLQPVTDNQQPVRAFCR